MKIIVIGAGAMGCLYGAYLSKNNDVTMLDVYEPQVQALNENGITVQEEDGSVQHFSNIRAMKSGTCNEVADLVIVFVKSTHTESSLEENLHLQPVADLLEEAGFQSAISDDIQRIIWSKLFVNLSINTFTAITETPIAYMIENQYAWDFAEKMICEAVDVAEADGTHFSYMEVLDMVHHVCENAGKGYSSMYQDVQRCIPTEIDAINGAIVEQARKYNVSVPYNSLIVDVIHAIEGAYRYRKE